MEESQIINNEFQRVWPCGKAGDSAAELIGVSVSDVAALACRNLC